MDTSKFNVDEVLIYDIETETIGDRPNGNKDKLKLFGFYSYKLNKYGVIPYTKKELIQKFIDNHRFLVGFNNMKYDNVVLMNEGFNLKYKRIIDLYDIFKKRAVIMITKKGMLGDKLMQYSLNYITRFLDLVDDDTAKEDIDYNIFKKKSWTKDEIAEMKKYTIRDIEITKKLYEWVENYFYTFRDFVSKRDVDNKSFLTDTVAMFAYKAICNALDWEPVLDREAIANASAGVSFEGGYVAYPAGERFEGNIYCLDFNCIPKGEMIYTTKGYKKIENVKKGDISISADLRLNKFIDKRQKVVDTLIELELEDGTIIKQTPEHRVLTLRGDVQAQYLKKHDKLLKVIEDNSMLKQVRIKNKRVIKGKFVVYDLTMERQESPYFVHNGILTHNSLYPSIMMQANLYGRNKNQNIGWHGTVQGVPISWEVEGYYNDKQMHPVGELLRTWYHLRLMFKRQAVLENGSVIKLIEADKYIGQRYYHVTQTKEGKPILELREMTRAQAEHFIEISKQGKDPREYTVKIIINCFHPDTEILTVDGIKNIKDIKKGDQVWSINPKTKKLEIKKVLYTESRVHNGYLDKYEDDNINFIVTPEHKFISDKGNFIKSKDIKELIFPKVKHRFITTEQQYFYLTDYFNYDELMVGFKPLIDRKVWLKKYLRNVDVIDTRYYYIRVLYDKVKNIIKKVKDVKVKIIETNIKNNNFIPFQYDRKLLLTVVAYFINYGSFEFVVNKNNIKYHETFYKILFRISERFNSQRFRDFVDVLNKLKFYYYISDRYVSISKSQMLTDFFSQFKDINNSNSETINFLFDKITRDEAIFLVQELSRTLYRGKNTFLTESKQMMQDFIKLVLWTGGRVNMKQDNIGEDQKGNKRYLYTIKYSYDQLKISSKQRKKVKYKGKVYNLSVEDNSTLLAGINGKFNWISQTTYGILNNPYYKLVYDPVAGADCTRLGRQWIKHARKKFKEEGYKVIYTDSVEEQSKINIMYQGKQYYLTFKELWNKFRRKMPFEIVMDKEYLYLHDVYTLSVNSSLIKEWKPVRYIMRHKIKDDVYKIITTDMMLRVTKDHSMINLKGGNLIPVKPDKINHLIVDFNGLEKRHRFKIEKEAYKGYVYDVEVDDNHNFFANDILVHNTDSVYIVDTYDNKQRMLEVKDKVIEEIKSSVPFPQSFFDMGIDAEIKYMFFFKGSKKGEYDDDMDEDDKINQQLGLMKKNYIYVEKDGKVVIKNLGIKKKSISALSKKIFWDYIVPSIKKDGKVMFSKVEIENIMFDLLRQDIKNALIRKEVDNPEKYKVDTSLQAQIAKKYGAGIHFLIPNVRGIGVGKGIKYCTLEEFKTNKLSILDIDLRVYWAELGYFIKKPKQMRLFG